MQAKPAKDTTALMAWITEQSHLHKEKFLSTHGGLANDENHGGLTAMTESTVPNAWMTMIRQAIAVGRNMTAAGRATAMRKAKETI